MSDIVCFEYMMLAFTDFEMWLRVDNNSELLNKLFYTRNHLLSCIDGNKDWVTDELVKEFVDIKFKDRK